MIETTGVIYDSMLDTSTEDNKENMGYFSDDERFEVDTLDDAAERYGDILDIDAEETPYLDLDIKLTAKPTAARKTAATSKAAIKAEVSNLHMCEMSSPVTIVDTGTKTESAEVV